MMYYKVTVECGHVGAGKSVEAVRYWRAKNVWHVFSSAQALPRAKRKGVVAIKSVVPISRSQYILGVRQEAQDPYLAHVSKDHLAVRRQAAR